MSYPALRLRWWRCLSQERLPLPYRIASVRVLRCPTSRCPSVLKEATSWDGVRFPATMPCSTSRSRRASSSSRDGQGCSPTFMPCFSCACLASIRECTTQRTFSLVRFSALESPTCRSYESSGNRPPTYRCAGSGSRPPLSIPASFWPPSSWRRSSIR